MFITGVNDTGDKLFSGVNNTGEKFIAGVNDTIEKFLTPANNLYFPGVVEPFRKNQKA